MTPFPNFLSIVPDIPPEQLKEILENAVSRVERGAGRFPQIAGFTFTWDPNGTAQVLDDNGQVVTLGERVRDGDVVADVGSVHVATVNLLALGGDQYPYRGAPFVSLGVTYRQAIANYIAQGLGGVVTAERYPEGGEGRIIAIGASSQ